MVVCPGISVELKDCICVATFFSVHGVILSVVFTCGPKHATLLLLCISTKSKFIAAVPHRWLFVPSTSSVCDFK